MYTPPKKRCIWIIHGNPTQMLPLSPSPCYGSVARRSPIVLPGPSSFSIRASTGRHDGSDSSHNLVYWL